MPKDNDLDEGDGSSLSLDEQLAALMADDDEAEEDAEKEEKPKAEAEGDDDEEAEEPEGEEGDLDEQLAALIGRPTDAPVDENIRRNSTPERSGGSVVATAPGQNEFDGFMEKIATSTDPAARLLQGLLRNAHTTQRRVDDALALMEIKPKLRPLVKKVYESGNYRDVEAARLATIGMLVSGQLKLPKGKATGATKKSTKTEQPTRRLTETAMVPAGGRAPKMKLATLTEIDDAVFLKAVESRTRLGQILYQRWRNGALKRVTRP